MVFLSLAEVEAVARRAHAGQLDKAGRPYAEHLAAVATSVARRKGSEEQIAAAWLHDAIEDGVLSPQWLASAPLSAHTKDLVLALTKRPGEDPREYAARIRATPGAVEIKEADLSHNSDPDRLARLDSATRIRLRQKYARMRRLLRPSPAAAEPVTPPDPAQDPGDAALLAELDRGRSADWLLLGALVRDWVVEDDDVRWTLPAGGFPYPAYGERVNLLTGLLATVGAVTPSYAWINFRLPQLSWEETYTPGDAVRAATAVVRGERFSDGTIATAYLDGTLYAIAAALVTWHQAGAAGDAAGGSTGARPVPPRAAQARHRHTARAGDRGRDGQADRVQDGRADQVALARLA